MHAHKKVKPASLLTYCDSHGHTRTFALPPGFCPEKGLEGKPKLIPVKNSRRGDPITNITHAEVTKDTFAQLMFSNFEDK